MTKKKYAAILLDLDGTLINLDLEQFISAYVALLAKKFTDLVDTMSFAGHLFAATEVMVKSNDPKAKNRDVFFEDFCSRINCQLEAIEPRLELFYRKDYPELSRFSQSLPAAREVVKAARRKGLPLVLATNPIFPLVAVEQRIAWGGLKTEHFNLVTTMDNMHFCKPNPNYYVEIAKTIGIDPEQCLMAGNDTLEDLVASETGMDTFLVDDFILHRTEGEPASDYRGSLEDLLLFIEQIE